MDSELHALIASIRIAANKCSYTFSETLLAGSIEKEKKEKIVKYLKLIKKSSQLALLECDTES